MGDRQIIGWREWVSLPAIGIEWIKAKVDTGARTSALHAFFVAQFVEDGRERVRFRMHPLQGDRTFEVECVADVTDVREITDSGGHKERRIVIATPVRLADHEWPIELTLTDRDTMKFRMLLGRTAMRGRFIVNPGRSFLTGRPASGGITSGTEEIQ
jgi:hypothetical protein